MINVVTLFYENVILYSHIVKLNYFQTLSIVLLVLHRLSAVASNYCLGLHILSGRLHGTSDYFLHRYRRVLHNFQRYKWNGKSCIVQFEGSEIPKEYLNQRVLFNLQGKQYEIAVEAVSYNTQYSGRDIGASLIVSQDYLNSLISKPTTLDMYIYYNQKYDEVLEKKITSLVEDSPYSNCLLYTSRCV